MSINIIRKTVRCEDFEKSNQQLVKVTQELEEKLKHIKPEYVKEAETKPAPLSSRELEVLKCISEGKSNKEIAQELFITLATVKAHVSNIMKKLGAADRIEANYIAHCKRII